MEHKKILCKHRKNPEKLIINQHKKTGFKSRSRHNAEAISSYYLLFYLPIRVYLFVHFTIFAFLWLSREITNIFMQQKVTFSFKDQQFNKDTNKTKAAPIEITLKPAPCTTQLFCKPKKAQLLFSINFMSKF